MTQYTSLCWSFNLGFVPKGFMGHLRVSQGTSSRRFKQQECLVCVNSGSCLKQSFNWLRDDWSTEAFNSQSNPYRGLTQAGKAQKEVRVLRTLYDSMGSDTAGTRGPLLPLPLEGPLRIAKALPPPFPPLPCQDDRRALRAPAPS